MMLAQHLPEPVFRAVSALHRGQWPYAVAAFHRIAPGEDGDELSYPPAAFAALCRYWRDHYEILPLDSLLARLGHQDPAPHPCLTITFDDGYADNAEIAADILDGLEMSATFFVTAGAVAGGTGQRFPWDAHLPTPPRLMSWAQVRQLHAAGFGIGSHTLTHARLSGLDGAALATELSASRTCLEEKLGVPVLDFAYPFGGIADCDFTARAAVRAAGYRCCLACHGGLVAAADSPFHLNRIAISPRWHATPQAWARRYARLRWCAAAGARTHW